MDNNKSIFAENLKYQMHRCGKTRREICEALGISYYTLSDWVTGKKYPRMDKVELLARYFGITKSDLIEDKRALAAAPQEDLSRYGLTPIDRSRRVPLLGTIACGRPILAVEDADETIWIPEGIHADFALRAKGDSMIGARITDGDAVYVRQQPEVENGEIAAVLIGEEATLKRVYLYEDTLFLRAENPAFPDQIYRGQQLEEVRILGKVVAFTSVIQ